MKKLSIKKGVQCMACLECVRACSNAYYKEFHPDKAALKIVQRGENVRPMVCVQCGKCAEVCPAGAAKLGQKLCTKTGPVTYPKQPLPDDNHWGEHMWSPNYKDDNQKQCHESGTAPVSYTHLTLPTNSRV